jgi:hypothetical protein
MKNDDEETTILKWTNGDEELLRLYPPAFPGGYYKLDVDQDLLLEVARHAPKAADGRWDMEEALAVVVCILLDGREEWSPVLSKVKTGEPH